MKTFKKMLTIVLCMALFISNSLSATTVANAETTDSTNLEWTEASDIEDNSEEAEKEIQESEEAVQESEVVDSSVQQEQEGEPAEESKAEVEKPAQDDQEQEVIADDKVQDQMQAAPSRAARAVQMDPAAMIGDKPYITLTRALAAAQSGDTIVLQKDITESIAITNSMTLTIDTNGKTWTGSGASVISISKNKVKADITICGGGVLVAAEDYRVVSVTQAGNSITLSDLTLVGNGISIGKEATASTRGGVIYTYSSSTTEDVNLTLVNCDVKNGTVKTDGGAIYADRNTVLNIQGGSFTNNHAGTTSSANGGAIAIYRTGKSLYINGTRFADNSASYLGGAIYASEIGQNVEMQNVIAENNTAEHGGAFAFGSDMGYFSRAVSMTNITANNNHANQNGGAIYVKSPTFVISGSLTNNTAGKDGGAIYSLSQNTTTVVGRVQMNANISNNTAGQSGGGVYLQARYITVEGGEIKGNTATAGYGGGAYLCTAGSDAKLNGEYTLADGVHIYQNQTPGDVKKIGDIGASSEVFIRNASSTTNKAVRQANTKLIGFEPKAFVDEETGIKYVFTKYAGSYGTAVPAKWYVGYYSEVAVSKTIYVDANARHVSGENIIVVNSVKEAYETAKAEEINKVYVCSTQNIGEAEAVYLNDESITWYRCKEHGSAVMFRINGSVTLSSARIDGANVESKASLIEVGRGVHLTITGTTDVRNGYAEYGGGISVNQGELTMEGGLITGNKATRKGGGIYVQHGTVNLEGGTISYNTSDSYGGGLDAADYAVVNMGLSGGRVLIDHNTSYSEGGGICYENTSCGEIYKATFTNNESVMYSVYVAGGAISIQVGASVKMKNVYVTDNLAKHYDGYGALYTCPTGETAIFEIAGALIVDNKRPANVLGSTAVDIYHMSSKKNNMVYVSDEALGGGDITFYHDTAKTNKAERSYYQYTTQGFSITSGVSEEAKQWAKEKAEADGVVVTGNMGSGPGSAIANNGHLTVGTEQMAMKVVKEWKNEDGSTLTEHPDQILVYLTRNGKIVDEETRKDASVVLSESNGWSYTWRNLDPDAEWSVVEANVPGFTASISEMTAAEPPVWLATDEFYVRTLTNTKTQEPSSSLTLGKTVYADDITGSYSFVIQLASEGHYAYYTSTDATLRPIYHNDHFEISLRNGETVTIEGIPEGTKYTVTEAKQTEYLVYINGQLSTDGKISGEIGSQAESVELQYQNVQKISIMAHKTWNDGNDQYGKRPAAITVRLLQNDQPYQMAQLTEALDWQYTFENLPKYTLNGELYRYAVTEDAAAEYEGTIKESTEGVEIINTLLTGISIQKTWEDAENAFALRPEEITVILQRTTSSQVAEPEEVQRITLTEEDADEAGRWVCHIEDLPMFNEQGEEYHYQVAEMTDALDDRYLVNYDVPQREAQNMLLGIRNRLPMGQAQLVKTLNRYNATLGGATFVFSVKAELDGQVIYSNMLSTDFAAPGQKAVMIGTFPVGTVITVEEVYSGGSYELVEGEQVQILTLEIDEESGSVPMQTASYVNDYNNKLVSGMSVTNTYTQQESADGLSIWSVAQHFSARQLIESLQQADEEGRQ